MHRTEIDGLRAVAVLSVIINHLDNALLPNGHLGVDIFFVISGFVITQSLISRRHNSFRSYLLGFYSRRAKRLVPALFLCVAVTCLFVFLVIPPYTTLSITSIWTGVAALFGLSNLYLLSQASDYFSSSAALNPFTHTWSLGVEEQFYFLFPFLIWISGVPIKSKRDFRKYYLIIGTAAITSLISYIWLSGTNPVAVFYLMPLRFWEIALGALAYLVLTQLQAAGTHHELPQYFTLAALLAMIVVLFLPQQFSQIFTTITVVILTTILVFGIRPASIVYKLLTVKPLVFIGVISYSLYLWHWSVLAISRLTIGVNNATIPFQLVAMFLLAFLSYRFVEKPLRQLEWDLLRIGGFQIREIGHSAVFMLSLALVVLLSGSPLHSQGYLYTGVSAPLVKKGVETLKAPQSYKNSSWSVDQCVLTSNNEVGKAISFENCTLGDVSKAERRFLVIGNSFSVAEFEMYKILVAEKRGSVTVTSTWGASPVPELKKKSAWDKANNYYWNSVIPNLTQQLSAGDVILMINDGAWLSPKISSESSKQRLNDLNNGLIRIAEEMQKRGIYVIYQCSNPFIRESNCTPDSAMPQWWNFANEPSCDYYTREESLERRHEYYDTLLSVEDTFNNFAILDLFDMFCPNGLCKFYNDGGTFLYRDAMSHPSVEAGILAQPLLLETVDKLIIKHPK